MASPPDNHRPEALAPALLLGRRYDLPSLVRQHGNRPKAFRQITPTEALRADMAAPYFGVVRAWAAERPALLWAYQSARSTGRTGVVEQVSAAARDRVAATLPAAQRQALAAINRLEGWHRLQWQARIKAATGLDTSLVTTPQDAQTPVADATAWARQLLPSVHLALHSQVSAALLAAVVALKPQADASADLSAIFTRGRKRAAGIGVDQTDRMSASLDRARRTAAGLSRFKWHHTPQKHPRADHEARDLRVYREDRAPNDRAGTLPFCRCWEEPLFE